MHLSLKGSLKSSLVFTYVKTDQALDLGNLEPFTIPDLSGNANTATPYTGIYVSTNGTTDNIDFGDVSFAEPVTSVTCKARSGTDTSVDLGIATGTIVANGLWQDVAVAANTKERIDFDGVDDFVQSTTVPDIASSTVTITLEYTAKESQFIELQSAGVFHLVGTLNSTLNGSNDLVVALDNSDNPIIGTVFRYNGLTVGDVITIVLNIDATYQITSATVNGAPMTTAGSGDSRQELSSKTTLRFGQRSFVVDFIYDGYFTNFSVSTDSTYDWDGTVLDATSKGWTINGSPDTTSLGYLSEFNYVVGSNFTGDLSDIALYGASGTLLHRAKLYDSADASLDGYPALDCVGGYHGTHVGCAGGASEASILQTAGEDFNQYRTLKYSDISGSLLRLSKSIVADPAGSGITVTRLESTSTGSVALISISTLVVGKATTASIEVYVPSSNTGVTGIWLTDTFGTSGFAVNGEGLAQDQWVTVSGSGVPTTTDLRIQFDDTINGSVGTITAVGDVIYVRNLQVVDGTTNHLAPESETTAGQDALGNAIENPRPNDRTINLGAPDAYVEIADADSLDLVNDFTFECWANFYGVPDGFAFIIEKGEVEYIFKLPTQPADFLALDFREGTSTANGHNLLTTTGIPDRIACYQIVQSSANGTQRYVDTVLFQDAPAETGDLAANTDPLIIRGADGMHVMVGDLRLYDAVLDTDQLTKNYNARKGAYGL